MLVRNLGKFLKGCLQISDNNHDTFHLQNVLKGFMSNYLVTTQICRAGTYYFASQIANRGLMLRDKRRTQGHLGPNPTEPSVGGTHTASAV